MAPPIEQVGQSANAVQNRNLNYRIGADLYDSHTPMECLSYNSLASNPLGSVPPSTS